MSASPPDTPATGDGICAVAEGEEGFDSLPGSCKGLIIGCAVGGALLCLCVCAAVGYKMFGKQAIMPS